MLLSQFNELQETISMFLDYGDDCRAINNCNNQVVFQISCHSDTILQIQKNIDNELPYGSSTELKFEDDRFELTIVENGE